jgi:uncharacterized protein YqeY
MGLQEKLREDLKLALRQRDACRLSIIRVMLAECRNEEKAKMHALNEGEVIDVLAREARRRNESIEAFRAGNRPDLVQEQEAALAVVREYLPAPMSRDELVTLAREAVSAVGASGMKDKGKVMQHLMPAVKGKAEGKDVNEVVTGLLSAM